MKKGSSKIVSRWGDYEAQSDSDTDVPPSTDTSRNDFGDTAPPRQEEAKQQCPDCRQLMQWKLLKGDCSNSRSVGQRCPTPSTHGWSCSSCKKILCVACLASLQKIEEGSDIEENWHVVPSKQRKPLVVREKETKAETSTASLVDAFCQRRELPEKVRQDLLAIPAQEVGAVLASLSSAIERDPHVDLRALLANRRATCASSVRRLNEEQSRKLEDWIAHLNLPDLNRCELFGVLSKGFDHSEIEYLMQQTNFARRCREGGYTNPISVACSMMTKSRLSGYQAKVEGFARWARLSRVAHEQLQNLGPKTGEAFMSKWRAAKSQDLDLLQIEKQIAKFYHEEMSGKAKKVYAQRVPDVKNQFRRVFAQDEDEGLEQCHVELSDAGADLELEDDEEEQVCIFEDSEEEDEWGPVELAPLPALKRTPGEDMCSLTMTSSSLRSASSLCRSEERSGKRVPVETHFIVVVDVSGSMSEVDCKQSKGCIARIEAVFNELKLLIETQGVRSGCDDRMSFITFNEAAKVHFEEKTLVEAAELLSGMQRPRPNGRTFYCEGLKAAARCAKQDQKRRPCDVIFLSDGEPTDYENMLNTVQHVLMPTRSRHKELAVHCIGFGNGAAGAAGAKNRSQNDVFAHLYQLSAVGEGHFHRASTTTTSLRGAFRAVTSTITATRTVVVKQPEAEDGSPGERKKRKKKEHVEKPKTFELRNVIFDFHPSDLGKRDIKAMRLLYEFDGSSFRVEERETMVSIRRNPFTKGGMRHCYGMQDGGLEHEQRKMIRMVAKMNKFIEEGDVDPLTAVDIYAKQTAVARYYAKFFRRECQKYAGLHVQLDFMPCYAYRPMLGEDEGEMEGFCGEEYVPGEFVKLTSNAGFVNREEYGAHANIGAAFSHASFEWSKGALLVADIQGVCNGQRDDGRSGRRGPCQEDESREWLLSDPQVLTDGASYNFGRGDLGLKGMQMFFKTHKCGYLCKKLGLKDIGSYKEPTLRCFIPGSTNVLAGLHGPQGNVVKEIRLKSGCSRVLLPREAYGEWMSLSLFSTSKSQANHAITLIKERVNALIADYGVVVAVPEASVAQGWNAAYWRSKRVEWIEKSGGAQIVLYRGGWMSEEPKEDGPVFQIYVFPKHVEMGRGQKEAGVRERDLAMDLIRKDVLGEEPEARHEPRDRRAFAKRIQDFVRKSGGRVLLQMVAKQFVKEIGGNKSAMEVDSYLKTLVLENHELLTFTGQMVSLPAPKATEAKILEVREVTSPRDVAWLDGTTWKEANFHAKYQIAKQPNGKPGGAQFRVTKICGAASTYSIRLHFDESQKRLYYGEKFKWYLSKMTSKTLSWSDKYDNVAYEWELISSPPKGPQKPQAEAWPALPSAPTPAKAAAKKANEAPVAPPAPEASEPAKADPWTNGQDPWAKAESKPWREREDLWPEAEEIPPAPLGPPPAAPQVPKEAEAEATPGAPRVWQKFEYEDAGERKLWWSNLLDEKKWFLDNDPLWERYEVPPGHPHGAGRVYRWNTETDECFFEDTGALIK